MGGKRECNREMEYDVFSTHTHTHTQLEGDDSPHTLSLTTFLNNRAACYLKTGECNRCIEDCTQSISFQPHNHKALLRRGSAYELKEK